MVAKVGAEGDGCTGDGLVPPARQGSRWVEKIPVKGEAAGNPEGHSTPQLQSSVKIKAEPSSGTVKPGKFHGA